ncbi:hypothetical protein A2316_03090 [Candidatus Falkowbacteria bacterium RIFOXYB2_FULL_38_15]|uniref:Uncharacterized protein n=1 Tax=Candidatus Falkowbacteria bacterium RIFOXYA2_FULL_38_12 TaxID=1797993 RepID=A0A1F5S256_9BACT|nr:MAG: hypothetical protein A2257_03405 [Candidatus Falkowbacteria bacterium RIFOXYA2_FULL_38_12]OGF32652.1 MAG: hypothetical protein A2316_03090 [Candidatus Falkowbacteria bacterium RIFOXYB2_FULL_38_15]OGF42056.1 MAG: hypothetical protein A2555_01520 [Candidatus Falkowbacteria bacterium RIFOXYD2_FULL_39_16]
MQKNTKIIIAFLVGALILFGVAFGFWYSKQKNNTENLPENQEKIVEEVPENKTFELARIEKEKSKCAENGEEGCGDNVLIMEAINDLKVEACNEVVDEKARNNCITEIAIRQNDEKSCDLHKDEAEKNTCLSLILGNKARESDDMAVCLAVPGESYRDSCFFSIVNKKNDAKYCDELGELRDKCLNIILTNKAFEEGDTSFCDNITDADSRESCSAELGGTDSDNDGLSNSDEEKYGTDPKDPDSDGDSYLDGAEVEAGYNPKGAGKLE